MSTRVHTIIGGNNMKDYQEAKSRTKVSIGESVCIIRELQELNQYELSSIIGIPESVLSAIEHDKVKIDVERAKTLKCHSAVLVFAGWDVGHEVAAWGAK